MRDLLRVLAVVAGLLALGLLAGFLLFYVPLRARARSLETELNRARQEFVQASGNLEQANDSLEQIQRQNRDLQQQLDAAESRGLLLSALNDVTSARLALAQEDPEAALEVLAATPDKLASAAPAMENADATLASATQRRLLLVLDEIPGDPQTAASDLEILSAQLQDLEEMMLTE